VKRRKQADLRREKSRKTNLEKRKRVVTTLWFEEELRNKLVLGTRSCWKGFQFKMINGLTSDYGSTRADLLAWYRENSFPRSRGRRRVTLSLTVIEQEERVSLRASWSSSGVANGKSVRSGCAYGWVETSTPFSSRFMNSGFLISIFILCVLKWKW
jgi:hypothetical protein